MKIRPLVPCGRTDGRTEMTKIIVAFRDFANAPGSCMYVKWAAAVCIVTHNNNNNNNNNNYYYYYYYYYYKLVHHISRNNCVSP